MAEMDIPKWQRNGGRVHPDPWIELCVGDWRQMCKNQKLSQRFWKWTRKIWQTIYFDLNIHNFFQFWPTKMSKNISNLYSLMLSIDTYFYWRNYKSLKTSKWRFFKKEFSLPLRMRDINGGCHWMLRRRFRRSEFPTSLIFSQDKGYIWLRFTQVNLMTI